MNEKEKFIESLRSAAGELTPQEANMFGVLFESLRSMPSIKKEDVEKVVTDKLGDFGDEKTVSQRTAEIWQAIESIKSKGGEEKKDGFWGAMRSAFEAEKDNIMNTANGGNVKISLREAGTITMANIVAPKMLGARDTVVDAANTLPEFLPSSLIQEVALGVGSNPWVWMERAVKEGAPGYVTEGNAKPAMDYVWGQKEVTAKVIAAYVPISKIATWNYASLENEVRMDLIDQILNKYNDAILNGAGTDEINGLFNVYATELNLDAFTAGTRTKITAANFWDVLLLGWQQSRKAVRGQRPDAVLVSIDLIGELDLQKNADGDYLFPNWVLQQDKSLKGARIIETEFIGDRSVLIGSFAKAEFNFVKQPEITIGWINDQFIKNQYCILCEFFGMQRVKAHKNNFVKITDIDAAKTTIDLVVVGG